MGILREYDSVAAKLIVSTGVDLNRMYTEILNIFGSSEYKPRQSATVGKTKRTETKTLDQFSRDLTEMARAGSLDPVIGRENEIQRVIQILSRRTKNNPGPDRRARRRQDSHRGRACPAHHRRRRTGAPEGQTRRLPGPLGHGGRDKIQGRF